MRRPLSRLLVLVRTPLRPLPILRAGVRFSSSVTPPATTATATSSSAVTRSFFTPAPGDTKPFFVTTPIFYVNASPHIGHLHTVVLTDVLARFSRLRHPDREVVFCTGTDEHGLKIQQAAAKGGMSEKEFCDEVSQRFRDLADKANISYTDFIRTSEERHYAAVEAFWKKLVASGDVYKGSHSGWYSVSDECFYAEKQVDMTDGKMVAIETGNEVVWQEEENWKFRLDNYGPALKKWLEDPEGPAVQPDQYHADILRQADNLSELSISRPSARVRWGVPVPGDESQTIYVWVDALINYLTVAGYPGSHAAWPADMHVVGKDIIRFHAQHWPALLAAAGEAPPRRVLAHAHWTMGRAKMSKSRGNVADPVAAMETYGTDGVRWYLMRTGGALPTDADYSETELASAYGRLQDQMGNLVGRLGGARVLGSVKSWDWGRQRNPTLDTALAGVRDRYEAHFDAFELTRACALLLDVLADVNREFSAAAPWASEDGTAAVVYAYHALRIAGILAQPVIPSKAQELLDRLGVPSHERTWESAQWAGQADAGEIVARLTEAREKFKGTTLFPRVELDNGEAKANPKGKGGNKGNKKKSNK